MNIYRNGTDSLIYFFVLVVSPVAQAVAYIGTKDVGFFVASLALAFGVLYDCFTRYDAEWPNKKKLWIFLIGACATLMILALTATISCVVLGYTGILQWAYLLLLPMIGPGVISLAFTIEHIFRRHRETM